MNEIRIGALRVVDGQIVEPVDLVQRDILGRGVAAELDNVRLRAENSQLRAELAGIREELERLIPAAEEAERPDSPPNDAGNP